MNGKKEKTLLIASYKRRYSEESLKKINKVIEKMRPDKIVIIKIVEVLPTHEVVNATVGMEEKNSMNEKVKSEKKIRADEIALDLVENIKTFDIPTEVCFRTGEHISEEIIKEFDRQDAQIVIIHDKKKGKLDKLFGSSTTEEILEKLNKKRVIKL